ncbi:class I SAM-dependent methyltransferase [Nannocystis pusilla]|uniref:class I SAM-dependent methyltransferase n=1 Tax=Nannocystis pusilla TaxID=889268 RepID=UPI003DA67655
MSKKTAKPPAKKSSSKQPPKKPAKTQAKSAAKKKPKQPGRKPGPTLAESADKFALYQRSVQSPTVDIEFFDAEFQKHRGRVPLSVREDFCGTALFSVEWCKSDARRTALGVDLDGPTLEWGRTHTFAAAPPDAVERVTLAQADVRDTSLPAVDLIVAMNFSYCIFKTREELRGYFAAARKNLVDDGVFALEVYGGTEAVVELSDERELRGGLTYVWEQEKFNPINHHTLCHITWKFRDGSQLYRAFTYDWRLWTLPELGELLREAGFSEVKFYFERVEADEDDDEYLTGTGEFVEHTEIENQEAWLGYVVALK